MIEEEIKHWYKDDEGKNHTSVLRLETKDPLLNKGYPHDGNITLRIMNTVGVIGFRLSCEESLKLSLLLSTLAKELIQKKRVLYRKVD